MLPPEMNRLAHAKSCRVTDPTTCPHLCAPPNSSSGALHSHFKGKQRLGLQTELIIRHPQLIPCTDCDDPTRRRLQSQSSPIRLFNNLTAAGTAKIRGSRIRHRILWVGLWVRKSRPVHFLGRAIFAI